MKNLITLVLFIVLSVSCIDQIEFDTQDHDELVVVDGLFTNKLEQQVIKLSYSINLNSQVNVPLTGAMVQVLNDAEEVIDFVEVEAGRYTAYSQAQNGQSYKLRGLLPDGRNISTNFQTVPDSFPISNVSVIDTLVTFVNESGRTVRSRSLEFYANSQVDSLLQNRYLRFSSETAYQVTETVCSPFHTTKTCYFYNDQKPLNINLIEVPASEIEIGFSSLVYRRDIDYTIAEIFGLNLSLYSYNAEQYQYWQNLKQIFDQSGNITDALPARIKGNIIADDGSEVIGQFAVVGKSNKVKLIRSSDFRTAVFPYCGFPGNRPRPLPDECCNCLLFNDAKVLRPSYWP